MLIRRISKLGAPPATIVIIWALSVPALAGDFHHGETLEIIVSPGAGTDSYDALGRLIGRHIGRHLPGNPAVVVHNMPGAGGMVAAKELYDVAPRDGTVIGVLDQSIYQTQLFKVAELKADVTKMNWSGRIISNNAVYSRGIPRPSKGSRTPARRSCSSARPAVHHSCVGRC